VTGGYGRKATDDMATTTDITKANTNGSALGLPRPQELSEWSDRKLDNEIRRGHAMAGSFKHSYERWAIATGVLLLERKRRLPYGRWKGWLDGHFDGSRATADRYVEMASSFLTDEQPSEQVEGLPESPESPPAEGGGPEEEVDPAEVLPPKQEPEEAPSPAAVYEILAANVKKELPALERRPPLRVWKLRLVDVDGQVHQAECRKKRPRREGPPTFAPGQRIYGRIRRGRYTDELDVSPEPNRRKLGSLLGGMVGRLRAVDIDSALAVCDEADLERWARSCSDDERAARELRARLERELARRRGRAA
jgi:hypothetical protein